MRYAFEDYVLDSEVYELRFKGVLRPLQPKRFDLLAYLIRHRRRTVLKSELLAHVWPGVHVTANALAQAVASVREALAEASMPAIVGVRGRGYRFVLEVVGDRADGERDVEAVIRVPARSAAPLATFRALLASYLEAREDARLGDLLATAHDEHAIADLVTGLFAATAPVAFVIENLERADLASQCLFALIAGMPRGGEGPLLRGTCAWSELAPGSASAQILARAGAAVSACAPRRESGAAPAFDPMDLMRLSRSVR
jgi:DNA-binding winged helix-turn-helix (wHTH) protein